MAERLNPLNAAAGAEPAARDDDRDTVTVRQPLTGIGDKFWRPGSVLKVSFVGGTQAERDRVMEVAGRWSDHANIQFDAGDHDDPDIRIAFDRNRHWSRIGTDSRLSVEAGDPSMTFVGSTPPEGTILHEFGHALGLKHEHQNPTAGIDWDKDAVYTALGAPPNNWSKSRVDGNVFDALEDDSLNYSTFDPDSVMGYTIPESWTKDGFSTSPADTLSPTDISYIGDWYPFGGSARPTRRPATDHLWVFTRGVSRRVFVKGWSRNRWSPEQSEWELVAPGQISGHVGVADANPVDGLFLAARGALSGRPFFISRDGHRRWSEWQSLGGRITGSPTVVRSGPDASIWVFVRGRSGTPYYKRSADPARWDTSRGSWISLGGGITGLVAASAHLSRVGVGVRGTSGRAFVKWWDGDAWHPGAERWMNLEGAVTAQPSVAWEGDRLHVVIRDPSAEPRHRVIDTDTGRALGPWQGLGGGILGSPTLVHGQDGGLHLVVRGTSRRLFRKRWEDGSWSPSGSWENLGGQAVDSPTVVALPRTHDSRPELHVFVTGLSRRGFRKVWENGEWSPDTSGWEPLGGQLA